MEVNLGDSENNSTSDDTLATVVQSNERDKTTDSDCGENKSSDNGDSDNATVENAEAKQSGVLKTDVVKSDETILDKLKCSKDLDEKDKLISSKNGSPKELISASKSSDSNVSSPNSLEDEEVDEQDLDLKDLNNEEQLIKNVQNFYPEIEFSKSTSDIIQEGKAFIIKQSNNVFYNPVQEFNRDLSVSAVSVFAEEHQNDPRCRSRGTKRKAIDKEDACDDNETTTENRKAGVKYVDGIVILEALSATGLRSIRYAKEVPGVKEVVANDISLSAVVTIKNNIEYNGVEDLVTTSHNDASLFMYTRKAQNNFFDVVDLDPYGCPSRFLDAAVQCVRDGGLLLVTCTDMAVLAGNSPETCYVKYGAISLRNTACHEMALRITLQCIESHANRYGRYIVPQISFSADFYIRVIVKVYTSPAMCKKTTSKLSTIYQCVGCQTFSYWPLGVTENCNNNVKYHLSRGPPVTQSCQHCGSVFYQGGPIWSAPLHNTTFVEKMLLNIYDQDFNTEKRMEGMLELIREELSGSLLYYTIDSLCSKVHCEVVPRNKFVSALLHAGYKVTLSHAAPNSIKTNAPAGVIWDIIRCWVKDHPVNPKRLGKGSIAEKLLNSVPRLQANFELHPEVMPRNRKKILRYQQNPQPFWGPGTRDKTNCTSEDKMSKSFANQNKKHKRSNVKAQMKAAINSKTIDIIEVVTLTDDDDDSEEKEKEKLSNSKKEKVNVNDNSNDNVKTEPVVDEGNENNIGDYDNIDSIKNEEMDEDSLNKLKKSSSEDDCKTNDEEEKLKTENLIIDETNCSDVET